MPELRCPCYDVHYLVYLLLLKPDSGYSLRARVLDRKQKAEENEDGCLLLPKSSHNRQMRITARCPFDCDSTYSHSTVGTKNSPGHRLDSRFCFLLKIIHVLDTSGKDAALALVKQKDKGGKRYEVSHLCHANRDDLCVEVQHFELEPKASNDRRISHQNGSDVCNCAENGALPCMVNGTIGKKVFNDEGVHVGWKRAEGKRGKRIKK